MMLCTGISGVSTAGPIAGHRPYHFNLVPYLAKDHRKLIRGLVVNIFSIQQGRIRGGGALGAQAPPLSKDNIQASIDIGLK